MTLNQVKKTLRDIAASHKLINSFYFGDLSEWAEFDGLKYTSCLVVVNEAVFRRPLFDLNLSLWITDRLEADNSNRDEVLSDTLQIVHDFMSEIDSPAHEWRPQIDGASLSIVEDYRGNDNADRVAGWKVDFSLGLIAPLNRCVVPKRRYIQTENGFNFITEDGQTMHEESQNEQ
jgi:hypothetical protein